MFRRQDGWRSVLCVLAWEHYKVSEFVVNINMMTRCALKSKVCLGRIIGLRGSVKTPSNGFDESLHLGLRSYIARRLRLVIATIADWSPPTRLRTLVIAVVLRL